jgi:hypothetical protein
MRASKMAPCSIHQSRAARTRSQGRLRIDRRRPGKKRLRMLAWRGVLSDEEIWQATAYVLSISQQAK